MGASCQNKKGRKYQLMIRNPLKLQENEETFTKRSMLYFLSGIIFLFGCSERLKGLKSDDTIKVMGSDLSV
jgi:hypothetical protein